MNQLLSTLHKYHHLHPTDFRCQHIAGIFYKRNLIALGFNQRKSHPLQKRFGRNVHSIYMHAEINAIVNALRNISIDELSDCTLAIIRVDKMANIIGSKPCNGCIRAIESFNIKRVIHS